MNNETGITALMSAFGRAYHNEHAEKPIFADRKPMLNTPRKIYIKYFV